MPNLSISIYSIALLRLKRGIAFFGKIPYALFCTDQIRMYAGGFFFFRPMAL
jgi:hypothetical protein